MSNKLKATIKHVFDNQQGLHLLKMLQETYVDVSAFSSDTNRMAYKLGQKELVQALIADLDKDEEIKQINTNQFDI